MAAYRDWARMNQRARSRAFDRIRQIQVYMADVSRFRSSLESATPVQRDVKHTGATALDILAVALYVGLVVASLIVAVRALHGAIIRGTLPAPPSGIGSHL